MKPLNRLGSNWNRQTRNEVNENWDIIEDNLGGSGEQSAEALTKANEALNKANKAETDSTEAKNTAESVQTQLNDIVIESGTSDAEVIQARGGYDVLNTRLNSKESEFLNLIEETNENIDDLGLNVRKAGLGNDPSKDDGVLLQAIFDAASEGDEIVVPYKTTLYMQTGVIVRKSIKFVCSGKIRLMNANMIGFKFVGKGMARTDFTENQDWYIREITGITGNRTQTALQLQSNQFSRFKIDHAFDLKHVVHFKAFLTSDGIRYSIMGENIFELTRWRNCDRIVYFEGGTSWGDNAPFCEGNQFINGFMSGSNHGIFIDNFIRNGGMLITCGIDNLEVAGSMDFVNNIDTKQYTIGNLILTRFIRFPNSVFKRNDVVISPNFGAQFVGDVKVNGGIETYDLAADDITKTDGVSISKQGAIKMTSSNPFPYIDFRTLRSKDYDTRINLDSGKDIKFTAGGTGSLSDSLYVKQTGIFSKPSGIANVTEGQTEVVVNFTSAMPNVNYVITLTPNWLTTYRVVSKSTAGFRIQFGTAAPASATMDYKVFLNQ